MKVNDITINDDGESVNVMSTYSAKEIQLMLQFAVTMAASIGLGAHKKYQDELAEDFDDMNPGLND